MSDPDRIERLRERAERVYPESWVPAEPGDEIAGELIRYDRGTTSFGEQTIAVLRLADATERAVWLLHTVLKSEFAKLRPKPGELVLVRYEGKRTAASGNEYAVYRVEVERDAEPPDWAAIGRQAEAELGTPSTGVHEPLEPTGGDEVGRGHPRKRQ